MRKITLFSPAKVNFTLEVSGKREDGYHELDSVVQTIDMTDELTLSEADYGVIEVSSDTDGVPSGPENLVYKACQAFFCATGIKSGAICALAKRIPAQAGLGGGSGNAAAAIIGLNRLYEAGLSLEKLAEIAASVGSDAPLFIYGGTVRMRGRGEQITALPDAPDMHIVVVKPEVGVSTAWAYGELDRATDRLCNSASDAAEMAVRSGNRESLIASMCNDFDPVVSSAFSEIARAKNMLVDGGAKGAFLCGSGSAVYGVFEDESDCGAAADRLKAEFDKVFVTHTLKRG